MFIRVVILSWVLIVGGLPTAWAQSRDISTIQERLQVLGFDPGPVDGVIGPKTRSAISAFQKSVGLPATGEFDLQTRAELAIATGRTMQLGSDGSPRVQNRQPAPVSPKHATDRATEASKQSALSSSVPGGNHTDGRQLVTGNWIHWAGLGLVVLLVWRFLRRRSASGQRAKTEPALAGSAPGTFYNPTAIKPKRPPLASYGATQKSVPKTAQQSNEWIPRKSGSLGRWIPPGNSVSVGGWEIAGMVYVGRPPRSRGHDEPDNAFIDPGKPIASRADDFGGEGMSYWPNYSTISPRSRATYLSWLAGGRRSARYNVGYMFLFFYGLERRFFVDDPGPEERRLIVTEVEELLDCYGTSHSVRRYLGDFLEAAEILLAGDEDVAPIYSRTGYEMPLRVRLVIGRMIADGTRIPGEWMLAWLMTHPETYLRTPAERAFPEFKARFLQLFEEAYPEGYKSTKPRRKLSLHYSAASGAFTARFEDQSGIIPDISGLSKPVDIAFDIASQAIDELDKFSRYLGRNPAGRDSIEAHALLPASLRPLFPCPELEAVRTWVNDRIDGGGLVPVADLLERLEGTRPEKLSKRALTGAADALARLSVGMAPDPRFAFRGPKPGGPVMLFRLGDGIDRLEEVSPGYPNALLKLTLGAFIAHADGSVSLDEKAHLKRRIDVEAGVSETEARRLHANLDWMVAVPPDLGFLRRRFKDIDAGGRHELGRLALAIAGADGHIDPSEIDAIQRLYKALDLDADTIFGDLHALATTSDTEPVTVLTPDGETRGHRIPPELAPMGEQPMSQGVDLDTARIEAIMADTSRVATVLHDVFADEDEDPGEDEGPDDTTLSATSLLDGLDTPHAALVRELLTRSSWAVDEFSRLAAQFDLLPAGALETLNEWAFDRFDDALVEEDDMLEINPDIAIELQA